MNWQRETQLAELAHTLRLLAIRFLLGELAAEEHKRQLATLMEEYELTERATRGAGLRYS